MAYVDVNGLPTWHEVHGDGPPVVLLHGAFAGASSWAARRTWWDGATGRWWACWWPGADRTWWTGWC